MTHTNSTYEWHAEIWAGEGDYAEVEDRMTFDNPNAARAWLGNRSGSRLALVFDKFDTRRGGITRYWAYAEGNSLPGYFTDADDRRGPKVPAHFVKVLGSCPAKAEG